MKILDHPALKLINVIAGFSSLTFLIFQIHWHFTDKRFFEKNFEIQDKWFERDEVWNQTLIDAHQEILEKLDEKEFTSK